MESTSELGWFREEVLRSILRPRTFARSLAGGHDFGLAVVLVALAAGMALSVTVDALVLAVKGIAPAGFASRLLINALLLGARMTITVAALALVGYAGVRVTRSGELALDRAFTAIAFALSPLVLAPLAAAIAMVHPSLPVAAGMALAVLLLRILAGLALNLRAVLSLPSLLVAVPLVILAGSVALADQVTRLRMTAYAIAPQLAAPLRAPQAAGPRYELEGAGLTVPAEWALSVRGVPGEIAHFETPSATLNVVRGRVESLSTMEAFANQIALDERFGYRAQRDDRSVERINGLVAVDDRADGTYEGRHIALRQFAIVRGGSGLALQFRFFDPADVEAAFAQAAAIAATLDLGRSR